LSKDSPRHHYSTRERARWRDFLGLDEVIFYDNALLINETGASLPALFSKVQGRMLSGLQETSDNRLPFAGGDMKTKALKPFKSSTDRGL
jgi:hypothetical protein